VASGRSESRYKADIAGGSLKVPESRIVAGLLLDAVDDAGWHDAIVVRNVLQKRSPSTAKRQATLVRSRLATMGPDLWRLVRDGSTQVATHAVLAGAIKHSTLLGDFLDKVVREQYRLLRPTLPRTLWADFLDQCRSREPMMPVWQQSTISKLADFLFRILHEAGFVSDTRTMTLQPVEIADEVLVYLRTHNEGYVLHCIQVSP
jgi:hypothetical protein